ncbi:MAG: hypothetical protein EOP53_17570, partial [Sphingobacteriales bacterium]
MKRLQFTYRICVLMLLVVFASHHCEAKSSNIVIARHEAISFVESDCFGSLNPSLAMTTALPKPISELRTRTGFNKDWKFFLGDEPGAKSPAFIDTKWRKLNLPHDWSIEGKFDEKNPAKPEG